MPAWPKDRLRRRQKRQRGASVGTTALRAQPTRFTYKPTQLLQSSLLPVVQNLVSAGCSDAEIGLILGATNNKPARLINKLRAEHPEFEAAWRNGQKGINALLVGELYKAAVGYTYVEIEDEQKPTGEVDKQGRPKMATVSRKIKHRVKPAEPTVAMFLVLNRMKEEFKNARSVDITQKNLTANVTAELTADQLNEIGGQLMKFLEGTKEAQPEAKSVDSRVVENPGQSAEVSGSNPQGSFGEPTVPQDTAPEVSDRPGDAEGLLGDVQDTTGNSI